MTNAPEPVNTSGQAEETAAEHREHAAGKEKKSVWDKASVVVQALGGLAIFVSLAGLFIGVRQFNQQQTTNAADQLNQQHQQTLNTYLDDMSDLVLNHKLTTMGPDSAVAAIAIARTATALRNLDPASKGILVRFLWEAGLILRPQPTLDLYQEDLEDAVFQNANLYRIYLSQLSLVGANFDGAQLQGAYLSKSVLIEANLETANLTCWTPDLCADLSGAYLMRADLAGADLQGADLTHAELDGANLSGANLKGANLQGALYNARPLTVEGVQGNLVTDMPTRWPANVNPSAVGATCDDCLH
jgi:uncharacterized protein YjbI with pentapeptide repeats